MFGPEGGESLAGVVAAGATDDGIACVVGET